MKLPLQVTFRNMDHSESIEANVRERASKLDQFFEHIMCCRVVVEASHRHHHKGNLYHVRIDMTVPRGELVVSRDPGQHQAHEDPYVAVRDAFNAARRQLENYIRKLRHEVKTHEVPPHGKVIELVPPEDYGRIETPDGRLVYFHRNSLINGDFDKLNEGDEVRFDESMGDNGPQASTVRLVGKHHVVA
jgi:ribosomal subunit interface protein